MASTSTPGARGEFSDHPSCDLLHYFRWTRTNGRLSDFRYQQLELNHIFNRGVSGAVEFR